MRLVRKRQGRRRPESFEHRRHTQVCLLISVKPGGPGSAMVCCFIGAAVIIGALIELLANPGTEPIRAVAGCIYKSGFNL